MAVPHDQGRAAEIAVSTDEIDKIAAAMRTILVGQAKRIDGDGWKVYLAGTVLRVDVQT